MKCKLTIEREIAATAPPELVAQCVTRGAFRFAPIGTLIDDPGCYLLVANGDAEAVDDECRQASIAINPMLDFKATKPAWVLQDGQLIRIDLQVIQWAALRRERGVMQEDFEAYAAGEMIGYDAAGSIVPGPNAKPEADDEDDEEGQ